MYVRKAPSLREGWGGLPLPKQGGLGWVSSWGGSPLPKQGGLGWVSSWGGSPLPREGVGRGRLLTLHRNPLSSNELHRAVKFFLFVATS